MKDLQVGGVHGYQRLINQVLRSAQATGAGTAGSAQGPMLINEHWSAAIDATNVWTVTLTGTGAASATALNGRRVLLEDHADGDTVKVASIKILSNPIGYSPASATDLYTKLVLEFEMSLDANANTNDDRILAGFAATNTAVRLTNNIIGFGRKAGAADVLQTVTDKDGTEATNDISGITLANVNKYKVVVRSGAADFYINDALLFTHSTAANLPVGVLYAIFSSARAVAGGGIATYIGAVRCWRE